MLKIDIKVDQIDFNTLADKLLPDQFNNSFVKTGIRILPAKEKISAFLIDNNSEKISEELNNLLKKENIPIKIKKLHIEKI
ncbi:hypothetical protein I5677_10600 [Mobilitalea sibirica]|uniref:Uncharacterized protein n=1 Tax=Mobilitalea sibirica TaxID=1462919 RepID=A0A8J7H344_9FIRM|nr:hypothetical protein [Mobilitalea sibirica]MBH1941342.1 hypothetical protein [Mobilitalea sibirica]